LSGGTSALSYSIAALTRDSEVTMATDGTYDFGSTGPELIIMYDETLADGAGNITPILGPNTVVTAGNFVVDAVAKMPAGLGIRLDNAAGYRVNTVAHTRGFESRTYYWPQANQDNAASFLLDSGNAPTWQIKPIWNMSDFDYGGTDTDFFVVTWSKIYEPTRTWKIPTILSANSIATKYYTSVQVKASSSPGNSPFDEPYTTDFLYDQGDVTQTGTGSLQVETRSPSVGRHYSKISDSGLTMHEPTGPTKVINSFTYPGYIDGFDVANGWNTYEGQTYKAAGVGAACRIVVSDTADHALATKTTILEPVSWANGIAKAKLRAGWWDLDSLTGKYLCIIGADNTQIGTGVQI